MIEDLGTVGSTGFLPYRFVLSEWVIDPQEPGSITIIDGARRTGGLARIKYHRTP